MKHMQGYIHWSYSPDEDANFHRVPRVNWKESIIGDMVRDVENHVFVWFENGNSKEFILSEDKQDLIDVSSVSQLPKTETPTPMPEKGLKWDEGKLDWHAMPLELIEPLAETFVAGINRKGYTRFSCLGHFDDPKIFFSAIMRHAKGCQRDPLAIDNDPEKGTGCFHAACIAFNALMYLYHSKNKK